MKILIVYCHPRQNSFNHAILENTLEELQSVGHEVKVADLYTENFQPALIAEDYVQFERKPMPEDVQREQQRVEWADGIVFIFPLWWWSLPAMLKGWIDRVMCYGWAWEDPMDPKSGSLEERKILVLMTAGASQEQLAKREYDKAFHTQIEVGIWDYCGFRDYHMQVFDRIHDDTDPDRLKNYLVQAREICIQTFSG